MRTRLGALRHLLTLASVAACCGGDRWAGTVTDSAGVTIVANTDRGMWGDGEGWTLEEELRIGTVDGDAEFQFGRIGLIAVRSGERILVPDAQARSVRVFSPNGTRR